MIIFRNVHFMNLTINNTIYFFSAFLLGLIFIKIYKKIFAKNNFYDQINSRSSHKSIAYRCGGISVFSSIFLITCYLYAIGNEIYDFSIILPLGILTFVGLYDDIYNTDFKLKFIFQIIAAKIIIDQGLIIDNLNGFFGIFEIPYFISQIITIFFILFILNSFNFSDGIDGLAVSIFILSSIFISYFSNFKISGYTFLMIITVFALITFYKYNLRKQNKIFLGDAGTLLLGGIISISLISTMDENSSKINNISLIFICYLYPIIDTLRVLILRLKNKVSIFNADQKHIHHLIINRKISHPIASLIIISTSLLIQLIILISTY